MDIAHCPLSLRTLAVQQWSSLIDAATSRQFETLRKTIVVSDGQGHFVRPLSPAQEMHQ